MKNLLTIVTVIAVLGAAAVAFAHGPGFGWGGGHMMGWGAGPMMGWGYSNGFDKDSNEYLEKTADIRRDLNSKMFDYREAVRAGDDKKAEKLATEIETLRDKLYENTPRGNKFARGGYGSGPCW